MVIGMAEFLAKVNALKSRDDRIAALRYNDSFQLRTVLQAAYDPRIVFLLPEGRPPFKKNDLPDQEAVFLRECKKLVYFVAGPHSSIKPIKREKMFLDMLEAVTPEDAELIISIKDKKLPYKKIPVDLVREAFPDLLPREQEDEQVKT